MENVKKIPMRQCMGCGEHKTKEELIRVVRTPEGSVVLNFEGRQNGRGAYICKNLNCLKKARKSGKIARVLSCEISPEIYEKMEEELKNATGM